VTLHNNGLVRSVGLLALSTGLLPAKWEKEMENHQGTKRKLEEANQQVKLLTAARDHAKLEAAQLRAEYERKLGEANTKVGRLEAQSMLSITISSSGLVLLFNFTRFSFQTPTYNGWHPFVCVCVLDTLRPTHWLTSPCWNRGGRF
jgi:hypothetical protein